jgi:hypothetical protein
MCRLEFQQVEKAKFTGVAGRRSSGVAGVQELLEEGVQELQELQEFRRTANKRSGWQKRASDSNRIQMICTRSGRVASFCNS